MGRIVMLFTFIVAIASMCCVASSIPMATIKIKPRTTLEQAASTVKITIFCISEEGSGISVIIKNGSGTIFDKRHVFTARHVVSCPGASVMQVTTEDNKLYSAIVEYKSQRYDFARLVTVDDEFDAKYSSPVIGSRPDINDKLCSAVAAPERTITCGVAKGEFPWSEIAIVFSAATQKGNSGAPIYNARGELVGMINDQLKCDEVSADGFGCGLGVWFEGRPELINYTSPVGR